MSRIVLLFGALLMTSIGFSQSTYEEFPKNEVNWNIFNTIGFASVEVGYEYFLEADQSVGAKLLINDRPNFRSEKGSKKFKTNSVRVNYTYYFGMESPGSGLYLQPFLKYRFGDFEEEKDDKKVTTDMNAFMVGIGGGYEWNLSNSFIVGPFINIGRNFSSEVKDRFSSMEWNAGLNLGYRF